MLKATKLPVIPFISIVGIFFSFTEKMESSNRADTESFLLTKPITTDTLLAAEYFENALDLFSRDLADSASFYVEKAGLIYEKYDAWEKYINSYNELGRNLWDNGQYKQAKEYHEKALELCSTKLDDKNPIVADTYLNLGISHYYNGDFEAAIENYQRSLSIFTAIGNHASKIARINNNLGIIHKIKGNYTEAIASYNRSLTHWLETDGELHPNVAAIYNNLGYVHQSQGDYDQAFDYYQKALNIKIATLDTLHPDVAIGYLGIGAMYQVTGDNDKAFDYYTKALSINLQVLDNEHPSVALNYNNLGIVHTEKGNYQEALGYHQKALAIWTKKLGENHPDVAKSNDHIGILYKNMGQYDKALAYHEKALSIWHSRGEKYSIELSITCQNIGITYSQMQEYEMALPYYQQSLMAIVPDFTTDDIYVNPEIENTISKVELLSTLTKKADALQHMGNVKNLEAAVATYQVTSELITLLRTDYDTEGSKLFISNKANKVYDKAIAATLELYEQHEQANYKSEAFWLAEKNKANMLLEMLASIKAKKFSGVPDSLLEQERQVKTDLTFYNNEIQALYQYAEDESEKIKEYQDKVFSLRTQYQALKSNIEENFPEYYNLKYDTDNLDIAHFQQNVLQENQILLEYFMGEENIYIWFVDKNQIGYVTIPKPDNFESEVQDYLSNLKNRNFTSYASKGYALYQKLLEPVLTKANPSNADHLIIIPDGILGYLPFETLISENTATAKGYKDLHYLIEDFEVSYHYSASLLAFEQTSRPLPQNAFIGFAPAFQDNTEQLLLAYNESVRSYIDSAQALPYAQEEVETIASLLGGNAYTGTLATEESFKQNASNYNIIHLASHSLVDDTKPLYSKLIFDNKNDSIEDGLLHTYELYNMQLNADLVALSACNTGTGKYYKGEGIVSLARGFMYAGVPNVMMSLWSVADRPTKDIMQYFYEELNQGTRYATALHKAKLRYLESADNMTADPYYWGAFIYMGQTTENNTLITHEIWWGYAFVLGLLLITVGTIVFRRKLRQKPSAN